MLRKFALALIPAGLSAFALVSIAGAPVAVPSAAAAIPTVETAFLPDGAPDDEILLAGNHRRGFGGHHHGFGGFKKRHRYFGGFGGFKSSGGHHDHFGGFGGRRR